MLCEMKLDAEAQVIIGVWNDDETQTTVQRYTSAPIRSVSSTGNCILFPKSYRGSNNHYYNKFRF